MRREGWKMGDGEEATGMGTNGRGASAQGSNGEEKEESGNGGIVVMVARKSRRTVDNGQMTNNK